MKVERNVIRNIIAEALEFNVEDIHDSDDFEKDLAMNSMEKLDCLTRIEDLLNVRFSTKTISSANSINDIMDSLEVM